MKQTSHLGILVVQDRGCRAGGINLRLKRLGYRAFTSSTCAEAVRSGEKYRPDLAIVDIAPKGPVSPVAVERTLGFRLGIPVIRVVSAQEWRRKSRSGPSSVRGMIARPFEDSALQARIESCSEDRGLSEAGCHNESWCSSVVRSIGEAVIVVEKSGLIVFANTAALRLTGLSPDNSIGRHAADVFNIVSTDTRRPVRLVTGSGPRGSIHVPAHLILVHKDGTEKHIDSSAAPLLDSAGNAAGLVLVFRDVTEKHMIATHAVTRQKMEAIGALARGIAHDVGNFIGNVSAHASALADSLIPKTRAHEDALKIIEATKEARELTAHLMDLARASEPRRDQATTAVSVAQVLADSAKVLEKVFSERRIAFCTDDPDNMPFVEADAGQLLDALISVFVNSVEAMPKGGTLTVRVSAERISNPSRRLNPNAKKGKYAVIRISDTGVGMGRETLEHIFEPFFTTKQPGLVTGLGLTIVHSTMLAWGGWVTIRSMPRKGTTVGLYIPAAKPPGTAGKPGPSAGETILVIDDNEIDLTLFKTVLETEGYEVHTASNGADGLNIFRSLPGVVDVTIVDLIMPGMDGRAVLKQIIEVDPDASLIVSSGFSRDYVRSYVGHGEWGFVQKPVVKEQLVDAISRALDRRKADPGIVGRSGNGSTGDTRPTDAKEQP